MMFGIKINGAPMNDSREDNTQVKKWQQEAWRRLFEDNIQVKKWQQEAW